MSISTRMEKECLVDSRYRMLCNRGTHHTRRVYMRMWKDLTCTELSPKKERNRVRTRETHNAFKPAIHILMVFIFVSGLTPTT